MLIGSSPPNREYGAKQDNAAPRQNEKSLADIASSFRKANVPLDLNQPCEKGASNRASDLCAQWKAADAAESSATAAWRFGSLGAFIGILTLAAASAAAWYAKKAADYTRDSVIEAKRSANAAEKTMAATITAYEMQIRPYIAITVKADEPAEPFSRDTVLKFIVKNFGQTPASSVKLSMGEAALAEPIKDFVIPLNGKGGNYGLLAPGDCRNDQIHCRNLSVSEIASLAEGKIKLMIRLRLDYTWFEGSDCHDVTMVLNDPKTNRWVLMDENRRRNDKEL
jgi:hypothetical protein